MEQIRLDEMVTTIMYGVSEIILEQERLNQIKNILYMNLCKVQLYQEETSLSTTVDNSAEWVRLFIASMIVRGCTPKTIDAYRQEYKMFLGMMSKSISDITTSDVRGYLAHCKLVRKNTDVTINNKTRMLRSLFKWLIEEEYIEKNPMLRIKDNKVDHRVKEVFEDEQIVIIKDVATQCSLRDIAIVDFLHRTGVRISEMVALNKSDIDWQERQCIVYGKGRKERVVYFNGEATVHLRNYLESRTDDNPALFVSAKKPYNRLTDDGVRSMLKKLSMMDSRINNIKINPHKWRRQFVTEMLEKDVPLPLVADMVGHNNLNTTKNSYSNYNRNKVRDAHRKYIK